MDVDGLPIVGPGVDYTKVRSEDKDGVGVEIIWECVAGLSSLHENIYYNNDNNKKSEAGI